MTNSFERSKMRTVCRNLADALDRCSGSTLQQRWNDFEKRFWPYVRAKARFISAALIKGLFTFPVATSPSTQSQSQGHPLALNRKILQLPPVTTVASGRLRSARRALRTGAALGTDEPTLLGFVKPQQGQTYFGWQ
jgi:hypothetical protein